MSTQLVRVSPEQAAHEKTVFLRSVMSVAATQGLVVDQEKLMGLMAHVVQTRDLDQGDVADVAKAQAIVIVLLNYALDVAASVKTAQGGDKLAAAVAMLTGKPLATLLAFAQQRQQTVTDRAGVLVRKCVVRLRDGRHYGLLSAVDEQRVRDWAGGRLGDHAVLPIATLEEETEVTDALTALEVTVAFAGDVNWDMVLAPTGVSQFSAAVFRRDNAETPNPRGGVWHPFLVSLMVNAITNHWGTPKGLSSLAKSNAAERCAYVSATALANFLAMVQFEPEQIGPKIAQCAFRLSELLMGKEALATETVTLFGRRPRNIQKVTVQLLDIACAVTQEVASDTQQFYLKGVRDVDVPTETEIDAWWHSRLLLYIPGYIEERLTRTGVDVHTAPWYKVETVKTAKELRLLVENFHHWPVAEQMRFVMVMPVARLLAGYTSDDTKAMFDVLLKVQKVNQDLWSALVDRDEWEKAATLVADACRVGEFRLECHTSMAAIARKARWTVDSVALLAGPGDGEAVLRSVLQRLRDDLTEEGWRRVAGVCNDKAKTYVVWEQMPVDKRIACYDAVNAEHLTSWFLARGVGSIERELGPIAEHAGTSIEEARRFYAWAFHQAPLRIDFGNFLDHHHAFMRCFAKALALVERKYHS